MGYVLYLLPWSGMFYTYFCSRLLDALYYREVGS